MYPNEADSVVRPGDVVNDKYQVEAVIGAGGMGVVAAARHVELGQRVALKFLLPGALLVPGAVERFIREARAAVQLQSQHVARVFDVGRLPDGTPFMVMELLEGCDLGSLCKSGRKSPLRVGDVVEYVIQACEAVAEAHALGIVHRDLKPANLFLTRRRNGAPLVKVLDFGISKVTNPLSSEASLTKTSDVVGSPYYMAPEQVRSARDVDARTDIWALGVILYELIAGEVPFVATSVPQLCAKVLEEEPIPLQQHRPDLPEGLSEIVAVCLRKRPEERYATVQDLVRALAPFATTGMGQGSSPNLPAVGTLELPPLPVRSSLTLGQTLQQDSHAGGSSGFPNASGTLDGAAGQLTAGEGRKRPRRTWLLWAAPVAGLAAVVALTGAIWVVRGIATTNGTTPPTEVVASSAVLPPSGPVTAAGIEDAPRELPAPEPAPVASASGTPVTSSSVRVRVTPVTVSEPKGTSAATTATPAVPTTKGGDDFLPTDRK
jgi:serine/threonine-protein kinase